MQRRCQRDFAVNYIGGFFLLNGSQILDLHITLVAILVKVYMHTNTVNFLHWAGAVSLIFNLIDKDALIKQSVS